MTKYTKVLLLSLLLSCTLLLSSCISSSGSGLFIMSISRQNDTSFSMEYERFNGHKTYKVDYKKDMIVSMSFETESGILGCRITNKEGEVLFDIENVGTINETITIPSTEKYYIYLYAKDHSGSFKFSWK